MDTILQIRSNGQLTLPASLRHKHNIKEGDVYRLEVGEDGTILLIPVVLIDRINSDEDTP